MKNEMKIYPKCWLDVLRLVLGQCSLYDLFRISNISSAARHILSTSPHLWILARKRLDDVPAPPALTASGYWSHVAYVRFIFGPAACTMCNQRCIGFPACFALGVRFCSRTCEERISKRNELPVLRHWTSIAASATYSLDDISFRRWLPPPYRETTKFHLPSSVLAAAAERQQAKFVDSGTLVGKGPFVTRTSEELEEEWCRRLRSWYDIKANHLALEEWVRRYQDSNVLAYLPRSQKLVECQVRTTNEDRVEKFAAAHHLHLGRLLQTRTVRRLLAAFNRDKTLLDQQTLVNALANIRSDIRYLNIYYSASPFYTSLPGSTQKAPVPDIQCPHCPATFLSGDQSGFDRHGRVRHKNVRMDLRCSDCPSRNPVRYDFLGMVDHFAARHM